MNTKTLLVLGAVVTVASANASLTGNLYLAQGVGASGSNFVNQVFGDFPTFSTVSGNVVTVGGTGWNVSNIQSEFVDAGSFVNDNVNTALLTVSMFSGTPSSNHGATVSTGADIVFSGNVTASITNANAGLFNFEVDTTGISQLQGLAAGSYLFTLTPIADFGVHGQAFNTVSTDTSTVGWTNNPGGGFGFGAGWQTYAAASLDTSASQFSLGINGTPASTVPEPASMAVIGLGVAALLRRRKK